jgi:NhaP-type Na+/H+ or K+/H+ antiporter
MGELEQLLGLFVAAVILAAAARRVGAPYPVFLALGGALLGFFPNAPTFTVPPELALALFVAPVLLDAAYDTSLRDLRDNWVPVISLVVFAVGFTTATVAIVVHALVRAMPWAAAIALGAVVAPPDAVVATAVLRPLRPPHRLLTIVEGESLLNDATGAADLPPRCWSRERLLLSGSCAGLVIGSGRQLGSRDRARMAHATIDGACAPRADCHHSSVRRNVRRLAGR